MALPYVVTVLYPNDNDANFKLDYYTATHMPLVLNRWQKYGLQKWEVIKIGPGLDGNPSQYNIQANLTFKDPDAWKACLDSPEKDEVLGDIPNFSNKQPLFVTGMMQAHS